MIPACRKLAAAVVSACALGPHRVAGLSLRPSTRSGVEHLWEAALTGTEMSDALLNFEEATLVHSNLGGQGPDKGQESLIISKTGLHGNTTISMKFTVADGSTYEGKSENNGVHNGVASINLLNGGHTTLNVELLDGNRQPLTIPHFFMSVLDIDAGSVPGDGSDPNKKAGIEEVEFFGIDGYYIDPAAQILVEEKPHDGLSLVANLTGNEADNPTSPWGMTHDQILKTAMVEFIDVQSFQMKLAIGSQPGTNGRNFQLTGICDLIAAPFGPCKQATFMDLGKSTLVYNNLAGKKPGPKEMVFASAATFEGAAVDLVVKFKHGNYTPPSPAKNGKFGDLGQINMGGGDEARFSFTFVETGTKTPVELPDFFFSFFDIDQTADGSEVLTVDSGRGKYFLSEASTLTATATHGKVTFTSGAYGNDDDNKRTMRNVDKDKAVTLYFKDPVSSFTITYAAISHTGRNFQFGGMANNAC